jgi:hypothetical protein
MVGTWGDVWWCADGADGVGWFYLTGVCLVFPPVMYVCAARSPVLMPLSFGDDLVLFGVCARLPLTLSLVSVLVCMDCMLALHIVPSS